MRKKYIIMAAVLAALIIFAIIMFGWLNPKFGFNQNSHDSAAEETNIPALPSAIEQTADPTSTPSSTPLPSPKPNSTEETTATTTPAPTKKPASTAKNGYAFSINIAGRKINVAYGVDEATLDKTPGWMETSAAPGTDGMCVAYGHRNRTHLRALEKVKIGDPITVTMPDGVVHTYTVTDTTIYEKTEDLRLPFMEGKTLVLVTCYPFRYSGSAPGKYVAVAVST